MYQNCIVFFTMQLEELSPFLSLGPDKKNWIIEFKAQEFIKSILILTNSNDQIVRNNTCYSAASTGTRTDRHQEINSEGKEISHSSFLSVVVNWHDICKKKCKKKKKILKTLLETYGTFFQEHFAKVNLI